jgi:hypothetical protein
MKVAKTLGLVLAILVALLALVVGLAFVPAVQTWAVQRFLPHGPELTVEVGSVSAGLSSAEVRDLRVTVPQGKVTVASVAAEFSAWDYLGSKKINVASLKVDGIDADLRPAAATSKPAPTVGAAATAAPASANAGPARASANAQVASPAAPFNGVLDGIELPVDLQLGRLAVEGKVTLTRTQLATFRLTAKDLGTGRRGELTWESSFTDTTAAAALTRAQSTGRATLGFTAQRRLEVLEVQAAAALTGAKLPRERLALNVSATRQGSSGDESYIVAAGWEGAANDARLVDVNARYTSATKAIEGDWRLAVRSEPFAALLAGAPLPDVLAKGSGHFVLRPAAQSVELQGDLTVDLARLDRVAPELAPLGRVQAHATFAGGANAESARLEKLQLDATAGSGAKFAELTLAQPVSVVLADQRVILANPNADAARLALKALPLAWAKPFLQGLSFDGGEVSAQFAIQTSADGSRVRVRALDPLTISEFTLRDAQRQPLLEKARVTLRTEVDHTANQTTARLTQLEIALAAGDSLKAEAAVELTTKGKATTIGFSADMNGRSVSLHRGRAPIDPGTLNLNASLRGSLAGDSLTLERATAAVRREGGAALVDLELLQVLRADLKQQSFAATKTDAPLARVKLGELPLAWAQPFAPNLRLEGALTAGTFTVTADSAQLALATTEPLTVRGLGVTANGRRLVQGLDTSANFSATKRGDDVACDLRSFTVKQGATILVSATTQLRARLGDKPNFSGQGRIEADLGALLQQPAATDLATLSRGRATLTFDGSFADTVDAKISLSARDLVAKQGNRPLGSLETSAEARMKADGTGTFTLPLTLITPTRKSDVTIAGTLAKPATPGAIAFTGRITSTQLFVEDFQPLAALAPTTPAAPASSSASTSAAAPARTTANRRPAATPDAAPAPTRELRAFWSAVAGRVELDLKRIVATPTAEVTAIRGVAVANDTRLALDGFEGKFKANPFKVAAAITFAAKAPDPYQLQANVDFAGIDVGELLRAANPGEKPMIESKVTVRATLKGNGLNATNLAERTYGTFEVTGGKGVLRALGRQGESVGRASSLLGIAGALAGSASTVSLGRLGQELEEMQFDQFTLKAERGADLNLKVSTLEFLSPTKRLTGSGGVEYRAGAPFDQWPFAFQVRLAGKDYMAQLLNQARVLSGQQDDKGYYPMAVPFTVSGTADKVSNGLWKILLESAAQAALGGFLGR